MCELNKYSKLEIAQPRKSTNDDEEVSKSLKKPSLRKDNNYFR